MQSPASPPPADRPPHRSASTPHKRRLLTRLLVDFPGLVSAGAIAAALVVAYGLVIASPRLPPITALTDYRPKIPLRIYTADHVLIGEFGEERRDVVRLSEVPIFLKQ